MDKQTKMYYNDLFYKNDVSFDEEEHTYEDEQGGFQSVTEFVGEHFKPFDEEEISQKVADSRGVSQQKVLDEWQESREYGTRVHREIEMRQFEEDKSTPEALYASKFLSAFSTFYDVAETYPEIVLYSDEHRVAGTVDLVALTEDEEVVLVDWKTSNKIRKSTQFKDTGTKEATKDLYGNNYTKYMLQLSIYAYLAEEMGVDVSDLLLVHLQEDGYEYYDIEYQKETVKKMLNNKGD